MSRQGKNTVDYIPLDCQFTDSIQAVENLYGNDGFVVWVKLLQKLGRTENYIIDVRTTLKWTMFYSLFRLPENRLIDILNLLADLDCINKELWEKKIIYSQNLVKRISNVYQKRKYDLDPLNVILSRLGISVDGNTQKGDGNAEKGDGNTQSKVKESKVKESKLLEETKNKNFTIPLIEDIKNYCIERNNNVNPNRFYDYYESKGWMIGKNKMKDWKAAVRTWEQNSFNTNPSEDKNKTVDEEYNFGIG